MNGHGCPCPMFVRFEESNTEIDLGWFFKAITKGNEMDLTIKIIEKPSWLRKICESLGWLSPSSEPAYLIQFEDGHPKVTSTKKSATIDIHFGRQPVTTTITRLPVG